MTAGLYIKRGLNDTMYNSDSIETCPLLYAQDYSDPFNKVLTEPKNLKGSYDKLKIDTNKGFSKSIKSNIPGRKFSLLCEKILYAFLVHSAIYLPCMYAILDFPIILSKI